MSVNPVVDQSSSFVTVGWSSHHDKLVEGLWDSFQNNYAVDFSIQWGERSLKVHRLLLDLFLSADKLTAVAEVIMEPDPSLDSLLEFLYRGKVTCSKEHIEAILNLAKKVDFQMFVDAIEKSSTDPIPTNNSNKIYTFVAAKLSKQSSTDTPTNDCFVNLGRQTLLSSRPSRARNRLNVIRKGPTKLNITSTAVNRQTRASTKPAKDSKKIVGTGNNVTKNENLSKSDLVSIRKAPLTRQRIQTSGVSPVQKSSNNLSLIKCPDCSYQNRCKEVMLKHQTRHKDKYKCSMCKKRFSDKKRLKRHQTLHETSAMYMCKHCSYQTNIFYQYQRHMGCHKTKKQKMENGKLSTKMECFDGHDDIDSPSTDKILLTCFVCRKTFTDEYRFFQHHEIHKKNWLKCTICEYKTLCNDQERFQVHVASHDSNTTLLKCPNCPKKALNQETLDRHVCVQIDQPDDNKLHLCPHCSYKTPDSKRHAAHVAAHQKNNKRIKCQRCNRFFTSQSSSNSHNCGPQDVQKLHSCPQCPFQSSKLRTIQLHAARHDPNIVIHKCQACEAKFLDQEELKKHQLLRCKRFLSDAKPYQCPHCPYTNKFAHQLGYHVTAVHSAVKPFKCQVAGCDYATGHKTNLRLHTESIHTDPNRFVCETCGFSTGRKCYFTHHLLTHQEEAIHKCVACERTFRRLSSLHEHMATHTGIDDRKHVCHVCGSSFRRRDHLRVHLRGVHKTDIQDVQWRAKAPTTAASTASENQSIQVSSQPT